MSDAEARANGEWNEARFRALTENSADIVSLIDSEGRLVFNSAAAERISGFTREELAGADTVSFMHPDDQERIRGAFAKLLAEPDAVVTVQYRYRHKSGGWTWMEAIASNRLNDPDVRGIVANSRDITERKRAEDELRRLVTLNENLVGELREAGERKNMFLAVLSHELRNPLAAIRYSVELLAQSSLEALRVRAVSIIDRQSRHLSRMLEDLLDVTRIASDKVRLRREPIELRDLVRRTVADLPMLESRTVELTLPDEPLPIDADPVRITQVITNLLGNAAKFTPADGTISVKLEASGGDALLEVADTGVGLDRETLARVFEPFAQSDRTLDRSAGGLGLGLALVRGLVTLHGGSVHAESDGLGHGARFVVRLPLAEEAASEPSPPTGTRRIPPTRRSILVIDDNHDTAESLSAMLTLQGHDVTTAHSGADGLATARERRPEIVVCDIGLPGMSGYEVARALRSKDARSPARLIALSGYTQPEDRERALQAGFDAHLAKPVALDMLEREIGAPLVAGNVPPIGARAR